MDGRRRHNRQEHIGGPRMYVDNLCMYVHKGRLRTGGAAAENNSPLLLRLANPPHMLLTIQTTKQRNATAAQLQ